MKNFSKKSSFLIYLMFFMPYIGIGYPVYLIAVLILCISIYYGYGKLKKVDIIIVILLITLVFFKIIQSGLIKTELFVRFYLGWFLLYYFMYVTKARIFINRLLAIFCVCVIFEAIMINTVLPAKFWPNYPDLEDVARGHATNYFGFYQRVYSIGGNASISSAILNILLIYIEALKKKGIKLMTKRLECIAFIAVLLFASGVGMFFYIIYWAYKLNLFSKIKTFPLLLIFACVLVILMTYFNSFDANNSLSKISRKYFEFLFDFKGKQITETMKRLSESSYLIGYNYPNREVILLWNDFALRDMTHSIGFLGLGILFFFCLGKMNRYNFVVIAVGVLSTLHYGSIFAVSGQVVFACSLLLNKETVEWYIENTGSQINNHGYEIAVLIKK